MSWEMEYTPDGRTWSKQGCPNVISKYEDLGPFEVETTSGGHVGTRSTLGEAILLAEGREDDQP